MATRQRELVAGYFADLKTMKSIYDMEWNADLRRKVPTAVNNILGFRYHSQLAIYRDLLKQMTGDEFRPIIVAVNRRKPDKEVIRIDEEWLEEGLEEVKKPLRKSGMLFSTR